VKSKLLPLVWVAGLALGLLTLTPVQARAQEGEPQVVDEVIAQVNDDVITLSLLKREIKERIEALKQNGKSEQEAIEATKNRPLLIATLINERLLLQKGKELEMTEKVEAEVNKRLLDVAKEQGIPSIDKLYQAMRDSGVDPEATKQMLRTEIMKQGVIQEEVDSKLYYSFTMDELHKYFDTHKAAFRKPEIVTISELFLGLAGKNEAEVKTRISGFVAQFRAGGDFVAICVANSEREEGGQRVASKTKCSVGEFEVPKLREDIAAAIKPVKAGDVSEPVRTPDGYQIIRVDSRVPGSDASVFNENQVRDALSIERSPQARDDYLQGLRNEAYIKIADNYKESVAPLLKLKAEVIVESTGDGSTRPADKKKGKGKFLKIFPKP
jgi:peptidyl-prolyl cis-trans isomerase SurA